jgi:hypothetical protein
MVSVVGYDIGAYIAMIILSYILLACVSLAMAVYLAMCDRRWWGAIIFGGALATALFLIYLSPVRIGTIMFMNGVLFAGAMFIGYSIWKVPHGAM